MSEPLDLAPILGRREQFDPKIDGFDFSDYADNVAEFYTHAPADIDALAAEVVRLRAENARLRDPFLWKATWYTRYVADGRTDDVVLDHGNLIELDHGIGQILFAHPDLEADRG